MDYRAWLPPLMGAAVPLVLLMLVTGCDSGSSSSTLNPSTRIIGSGVVVEEDRTVAGFDGVVHASEGAMFVRQGAPEALRIRAEDNLLPHILSEVAAGILEIRTRGNTDLEPNAPIEFRVTLPALRTLRLRGVGDVEVDDLVGDSLLVVLEGVGEIDLASVDVPRLDLDLRGVGDIDVDSADVDMLDVSLTGVGDIEIAGTAPDQKVAVEGLGDYDARDLVSLEAEVEIIGDGTATVRVSDRLTVTIVGNGTVFYIGNPVVQSTITGNGTVQQIPG